MIRVFFTQGRDGMPAAREYPDGVQVSVDEAGTLDIWSGPHGQIIAGYSARCWVRWERVEDEG